MRNQKWQAESLNDTDLYFSYGFVNKQYKAKPELSKQNETMTGNLQQTITRCPDNVPVNIRRRVYKYKYKYK